MFNPLDEIIQLQKQGEGIGIPSICSAHPWILKAAMQLGNSQLLIESTCNQVNQFGGYTGMTPQDFAAYVHRLADKNNFPVGQLILGGDHLGPSVWHREPAVQAMHKSEDLVQACVRAGYTKIHLDASMKLGDDDPARPLDVELAARRTAQLVKAAESVCMITDDRCDLRYIIGSEVPPPGGATEHEEGISVTRVVDVSRMLEVTHAEFLRQGLESAWERVIALVVQPGMEFGDDFVLDYHSSAAQDLKCFSETTPFVYEAHSTDYQTPDRLRNLVRDHFAILKVGPAMTFAFREAIFALTLIENELVPSPQRSRLVERLDEAMLRKPAYWAGHYRGTEQEMAFARKFSLSDRIRYYWTQPDVQSACTILLQNMGAQPLPLSLLSQYFPRQYPPIREGRLENSAPVILTESVSLVLRDYDHACGRIPSKIVNNFIL
jgi:D-tagatose-1,6-bisphosphate aldolase subunit GatZ/KbaZ